MKACKRIERRNRYVVNCVSREELTGKGATGKMPLEKVTGKGEVVQRTRQQADPSIQQRVKGEKIARDGKDFPY